MKLNQGRHLLIIALISFYSCKDKTIKTYYETGELKTEVCKIHIEDSLSNYKEYYKNGILKQEGTVKYDSIMVGQHVIYFADGNVLWSGEIRDNVIQDKNKWHWEKSNVNFQRIEIKSNPDTLIPNRTYCFRIIMPNVYPMYYDAVDVDYNTLENQDIDYEYPYKFTFIPNADGEYVIRIIFMSKGGYFIVGTPAIEITLFPHRPPAVPDMPSGTSVL